MAAIIHQFRREEQAARERVEEALPLSVEQGFAFWVATGAMVQGWALAEQGRDEEGIAQTHRGVTALLATGAVIGRPSQLATLAEVYGKAGQVEEGLGVLTEALAVVDKTGAQYYEAELYRLKGELTLQKFQVSSFRFHLPPSPQPLTPSTQAEARQEAEDCFLKAIDIARKQQAKAWELRATTSLARLWQSQGKRNEAHKMLSAVYNWFTEGFDTKDLQEAKALIEELSH